MSETVKLVERSEQKVQDTWKMEDMFETDTLWEESCQQVKERMPKLLEFQGRLSESAAVPLAALKEREM